MCYSGPISIRSSSGTVQQAPAIVPTPSLVSTTLQHAAVSGNFFLSFLCIYLSYFFAHSYYPHRKVEERSLKTSLNFEIYMCGLMSLLSSTSDSATIEKFGSKMIYADCNADIRVE